MAEFDCIRERCILADDDSYHFETHLCFVCGFEFMPSLERRDEWQCPACGWYRCPNCDGCKCSLSEHDQQWIDWVHCLFCQDIDEMANFTRHDLPVTDNPHVWNGLCLQLLFCKRWALEQLKQPDTLLGYPIVWTDKLLP